MINGAGEAGGGHMVGMDTMCDATVAAGLGGVRDSDEVLPSEVLIDVQGEPRSYCSRAACLSKSNLTIAKSSAVPWHQGRLVSF